MNPFIDYYSTTMLDISSNGSFSAAQALLKITRIGNVVTLTWPDLANTSSATPSTSAGFIPAIYRPSSTARNVFAISGTRFQAVDIAPDGTMSFAFFNWSGSAQSAGSSAGGSVSWVI